MCYVILFVNDELQRIWAKEEVVYFKVLSHHLPAGTERNHRKLFIRSRFECMKCTHLL